MTRHAKTPLTATLITTGLALGFTGTQARAQIGSSGYDGMPSTTSQYVSSSNTFTITEDVVLDMANGPWTMQLSNPSNQSSGNRVNMVETLSNAGTEAWTGWTQSVTTTWVSGGEGGGNPGTPDPTRVGFLFDNSTISLQADYGSGLVALTEGVEYTLLGYDIFGQPTGGGGGGGGGGSNGQHYSSIEINFESGFEIDAGDTLVIQKQIFEVFDDSNTWKAGDIAEVQAYPVPEPTSLALLSLGGLLFARRRRAAMH